MHRAVTVGSAQYGDWGEPAWTTLFASLGDFSITQYATSDPNQVIGVPDGSTYVHDVYLHQTINLEDWNGGAANPYHDAGRMRTWQTKDHDDRHVVGGGD